MDGSRGFPALPGLVTGQRPRGRAASPEVQPLPRFPVIELAAGIAGLESIPHDDEQAREQAVSQLRQRISAHDSVPFASEEGEWSKLFEEIGFGMWG